MTPIPVRGMVDPPLGMLVVNRPEVHNVLDLATIEAIETTLIAWEERPEVRVVVLSGEGQRVFIAGVQEPSLQERFAHLLYRIERFPKPVIAALNGDALGGGLEVALACDLRIGGSHVQVGFPETSPGVIPGAGGVQRLVRYVGWGKAKWLVLTGETLSAHEARRIGLIDLVVPGAELMDRVREVAEGLARQTPMALRLTKMALVMAEETSLTAGLYQEILSQALLADVKGLKGEGP